MTFLKPLRLKPGDTVAAASLSSGAAGEFPHVYGAARRTLEETDLSLIHAPNALKSDDWLYKNPEARADDLHWALTNPEIKGIFSTIGGYESVRVLPFLRPELIRANPKVLFGYSDTDDDAALGPPCGRGPARGTRHPAGARRLLTPRAWFGTLSSRRGRTPRVASSGRRARPT